VPASKGMIMVNFLLRKNRLWQAIVVFMVLFMAPFASTSAEKQNKVVRVYEVQNSIESFLHAIAVNGQSIEPTASPEVAVGDVITFQVSIQNKYSAPLFDIKSETEWGNGFSYQGSLSFKNVDGDYQEHSRKISGIIPEIQPQEKNIACTYTFDLKVSGCKNVFVNVYSDELYACEAVKTYHAAVQITSPNLTFNVSDSQMIVSGTEWRPLQVKIKNTGDGKASDLNIDTSFEACPLEIKNTTEGFSYNPGTGVFIAESISPGKFLNLEFDIRIDKQQASAFSSETITIKPVYQDVCGVQFNAPAQTMVLSRTRDAVASVKPSDIENQPDLSLSVSPECCRVVSAEKQLKWSIYVINRGSADAYDVTLKDKLGRFLRYEKSTLDGESVSAKILTDTPAAGVTTLKWEIGEMAPGEMREIDITAYPADPEKTNQVDGYFNNIQVKYGDGRQCCEYNDIEAPCFILPDECVEGEVFEKCGRVHGFFSVTQMYKSNLYKTVEDQEETWATYLTPGIWAAVPGSCERIIEIVTSSAAPGGLVISPFYPKTERKYQFYFLYSPQYEIYYDKSDENMVTHRADAYFRYNTRNKFSIRAIDQFKRSHDSISSRAFTIDDQYKSNMFNTLVTFDPTAKIRLRLDYSNFYLDYDGADNSRANRMDNSWSAYGYFNLTPKMSIFANYEFADINYDTNDLDSQENRLFAGLRWNITKKTSGQIKGGYGEKSYDDGELSDAESWMAEIQVDHNLTPNTNVVLNAYRRYDEVLGELVDKDDLKENFTKYILTHFIGLSLNYDLTTKLHLSLDGTYFYDEYKDEGSLSTRSERQDTEFAISPAVKFDFMKWLTFDLAYTYTNRDSNYSQFDYEDHTVFLRASLYQ